MPKNVTHKTVALAVVAVILGGLVAVIVSEYLGAHSLDTFDRQGLLAWLHPLVGLLGLALLWGATMLGALSGLLRHEWPGFMKFHRVLTFAALAVALAEPVLQALAEGLAPTVRFGTVASRMVPYTLLAPLSLLLFTAYAALAALARHPFVTHHWNRLQAVAYAAFAAALVYAHLLRPDLNRWPGTWIWYGLAVSFSLLASWRVFSDDDAPPGDPPPNAY